jgi:leucyl-tRNA synthetase
LGEDGEVLRVTWPVSNPELAKESEIEIPVQINGKLRSVIRVAAEASRAEIEAAALADEKIIEWLAGKTPVKIIVVPGKLVNLVVK